MHLTVESLLSSTSGAFEILVVDNGSTDGSGDFLRQNSIDPRVTLIRTEERLGVVGARNAGAKRARGEVVAFCDAHMLFPRDWLTPLLEALESDVGVVGPAITVWGDPDGPAACGSYWADAALTVQHYPADTEEVHDVALVGGGCQVMRRALFEGLGGFDEGLVDWGLEDQELCLRLWTLGHRVRVVPSVRVEHYFREFVPYAHWPHVTYNKLRTAFLHFDQERLARCVAAIAIEPGFHDALVRVEESDVFDRRIALDDQRVNSAEWFFARFGMHL